MASIRKGILGGIQGSVGNIVGFRRQGKDYIRTKPANVRNPNTLAQQTQRARFGMMISFLSKVKSFIDTGFKHSSGSRRAFSMAMSVNVRRAITGTYPDLSIDPAKLVLSRGSLYGECGWQRGRSHHGDLGR